MSTERPSREQRLQEVIAAYLESSPGDEATSTDALLSAHPDLAEELRTFLADHDRMTQAAALVKENAPGEEASSLQERFPQPFGDYELLEEIGRGGMGIVYKARQIALDRIVALKRIRAGQLASSEDIARFQREAKAAASLDHPHIVPIYEVGEHQGQHYFTMKLIEGGNLNAHLSKYANDAKAIAQLMIQLARAVHHAHQRGILHRDLKPGNILIDAEGNPHVSDFGLAQPIEREAKLTQSGAIVGTPEYMAPEQARGEKGLTTAADVYGLGAIFYVLLTGQPPFQGDYNWETLKKVVEEEPISPRSINRKVNGDLETICLKCLAKRPDVRYSSAVALFEDLERWNKNLPLNARRESAASRLWKWMRREPAKASLTLVMMVLFTAAAGLGLQKRELDRSNELLAEREQTLEIKKQLEESQAQELAAKTTLTLQQEWSLLLEDVRKAREKGERGESLRLLKKLVELRKAHPEVGDPVRLHEEAFQTITAPGATLLREMAMGYIGSLTGSEFPQLLDPNGKYALLRGIRPGDKDSKVWYVPLGSGEPVSHPHPGAAFFAADGQVFLSKGPNSSLWDPLKNTEHPVDGDAFRKEFGLKHLKKPVLDRSADGRWSYSLPTESKPHEFTDNVYSKSFQIGTSPTEVHVPLSFHPSLPLLLTYSSRGGRESMSLDSLFLWDLETRKVAISLMNAPIRTEVAGHHGGAGFSGSWHEWSDDGQVLLAMTRKLNPRGDEIVYGGGFRAWRIQHPAPVYHTFSGPLDASSSFRELAFSPDSKWLHADGLFWKVERTGGLASLSKPKERPVSPTFDPGPTAKLPKPFCFGRGKTWEFDRLSTKPDDKESPGTITIRSFPREKEYTMPAGQGTLLAGSISSSEKYALLVYADTKSMAGYTPPYLPGTTDGTGTSPWFELWDLTEKSPVCAWRACFPVPRAYSGQLKVRVQPRFQEDDRAFSLFAHYPAEWFIPSRRYLASPAKYHIGNTKGTAHLERHQDGRIRVGFTDGRPALELEVHLEPGFTQLQYPHHAISGDGRYLAITSRLYATVDRPGDLIVWLWDLSSGRLALRWQAHESPISALAFTDDGSVLATVALDGTLRLWNIDSYREELKSLGLPSAWPMRPGTIVLPAKVEDVPSDSLIRERLEQLAEEWKEAKDPGRDRWLLREKVIDFGRLGRPVVPHLVKALEHPKAERRAMAAYLLGRFAPVAEEARPVLRRMLKGETKTEERFEAIEALGELGLDAESKLELEQLVTKDSALKVRIAAQLILTTSKSSPDVQPCFGQTFDPDESRHPLSHRLRKMKDILRWADPRDPATTWAKQLVRFGDHDETTILALELLVSHSHDAAAFFLGHFDNHAQTITPVLANILQERDSRRGSIPEMLFYTLERFGPHAKDALPVLEKLASDKDDWISKRAKRARAVILGDDAIVPDLVTDLEKPNAKDRLAVFALKWFSKPPRAEVIEALGHATTDSLSPPFSWGTETHFDNSVAIVAMRILASMGPESAPVAPRLGQIVIGNRLPEYWDWVFPADGGPQVKRMIRPADRRVFRIEAARTLAAIGPKARVAIPDLVSVLMDRSLDWPDVAGKDIRPGRQLRFEALDALVKIAPAEEVIPHLETILNRGWTVNEHDKTKESILVLRKVVDTLKEFGPGAGSARPALEKLRADIAVQLKSKVLIHYRTEPALTLQRIDALLQSLDRKGDSKDELKK